MRHRRRGAIGGHIAAKPARGGEREREGRGARGAPEGDPRERSGLSSRRTAKKSSRSVEATDRIAEAGGADLIVLAVKAHQVAAVAATAASIGSRTTVMTPQNGIPWWYCFKLGGPYEAARLESVDPAA